MTVGAEFGNNCSLIIHVASRIPKPGVAQKYERVWISDRQFAKQKGIENREDGGVGADAQGESEYGDGRKARRFAQSAEAVAQVLDDCVQPCAHALGANAFLGLLDAAQLDLCGAAGFYGRHAVGDVLFCFGFDVVCDFIVDFAIEFSAMQERAKPERQLVKQLLYSYPGLLLWGSRPYASLSLTTREIAPDNLPQLSASFSSCRRPIRVSE